MALGRDSLGDRMKSQYEDRTRISLPRRTYTIIRVDGKAFHTFTRRHCDKEFDWHLSTVLNQTMLALVNEIQGSCFAYRQSDEISVLLADLADTETQAWFDGNLQKMVSVAASITTAEFNFWFKPATPIRPRAMFDARAFTIPDPVEVENYFIWRQQDATRNSIQSYGRSKFSQKELHGKSCSDIQDLLYHCHNLNWNDLPVEQKRGVCYEKGTGMDFAIPVFTQERSYLTSRIPKHGYEKETK